MIPFAARYTTAFMSYMREPDEETLGAAYELGRQAVHDGVSVTQVAVAHHDALAVVLAGGGDDSAGTARAAGDFLLEVLAAFDMVQRGFHEVRETAQRERRHADLLRQLSHFLADTSLASADREALDEVLHLVAEQAREMTAADAALLTLGRHAQAHPRAGSYPEQNRHWEAFVRWTDLTSIDTCVRTSAARALRVDGERLAEAVGHDLTAAGFALHDWMGLPLPGLGGEVLGALHLLCERSSLPAADEAVGIHLAEMCAAAVERADMHAARRRAPAGDGPPAS
jgi:hypothetical protein